jgi:putative ABC transport system permease protein
VWRFAPYVLKSLWRSRTRTALTVSGAAVAVFVFCFVAAVQDGLAALTHGRDAERTLIVFQSNRFCPFTSRLPEDYGAEIAKLPGVEDATPLQVFMNNCRASLDLVVFHGIPPEKLRAFRDLRLVEGSWEEFVGRRDAAVVGRALAQRRGLHVGQKFSIGGVTVEVVGIYTAANAAEESFLYTQLEFLQRAPGINAIGRATQFEVRLREGADAQAVARAIDERFAGGPVQTDTRTKGAFEANAVGDLVELIDLAHYLGYACLGLLFALTATTAVMAVQDRVREYAVLQTLGFSGPRIFGLVVAEGAVVGLLGGLIGAGAATAMLAWGGLTVGTEGVTIAFSPSVPTSFAGLAVALAVAALASLAPAWRAARAEIVASLRAV